MQNIVVYKTNIMEVKSNLSWFMSIHKIAAGYSTLRAWMAYLPRSVSTVRILQGSSSSILIIICTNHPLALYYPKAVYCRAVWHDKIFDCINWSSHCIIQKLFTAVQCNMIKSLTVINWSSHCIIQKLLTAVQCDMIKYLTV